MKSKWVWALLGTVAGVVLYAGTVLATPGNKLTTTPIARGHFADIDSTANTDIDRDSSRTDFWQARIKTKGDSDVYMLENRIEPGGTFGWHSHPGPSLVIVREGTATFYLADDPTCSPHVVRTGEGFVDSGGDVHLVRNEGSVDLVTDVVSLVPAGFERRIDQPAPPNCADLPNG